MVRNSIALVPLVGVLIALMIVAIAPMFTSVDLQVPRKLDDVSCGPDEKATLVRVALHADSSVDLTVGAESRHLGAAFVLRAVVRAVESDEYVGVRLAPDESVSWQQVVEMTSSLGHATALPVALETPNSPPGG